jgi:hypothetical protein
MFQRIQDLIIISVTMRTKNILRFSIVFDSYGVSGSEVSRIDDRLLVLYDVFKFDAL